MLHNICHYFFFFLIFCLSCRHVHIRFRNFSQFETQPQVPVPLLVITASNSSQFFSYLSTIVKNEFKGKPRQSLRTSLSRKYSKAKASPAQRQKSKFLLVHETVEDDNSSHSANVEMAGKDSESDHPQVTSSERGSPVPVTIRLPRFQANDYNLNTSAPLIAPSAFSSTITKWMAKKATSNDQNTRCLLGQLAKAVPLQPSTVLDKAHEETVRGLT